MAGSPWWSQWEAEPGRGQISAATIAAVRAQPRFHDALAHTVHNALRLVDEDPEFHRTMPDMESLVLGVVALHLDATGGLTHRRLRDMVGLPGVLSAGRVTALLLRMQAIGFVTADKGYRPGARKVYRPTPRMTTAFRMWAGGTFEALQLMEPGMGALRARFDEPDGLAVFMGVLGQRVMAGVTDPHTGEEGRRLAVIQAIGAHRGGLLAMLTLLDAASARAGSFPAAGPVAFSISALARRCLISRSHLLRILRHAEAHGLFRRTDDGGDVLPPLIDVVERLHADIYVRIVDSAHRALGDGSAPR